jgi:ATP-dependent DNA ligase
LTKTIQLAQSKYTPAKLGEEVYLSEKLDGVPVRFDFRVNMVGNGVDLITMRTRQDEFPNSCQFILAKLMQRINAFLVVRDATTQKTWAHSTMTLIGEVTHEDYTAFKDISGVVRRQTPQSGLILNLFDFNTSLATLPFAKRLFLMQTMIPMNTQEVRRIVQVACHKKDIDGLFDAFMAQKPSAEGMIVRDANGKFEPGKRTWCYQKLLRKPTIDLYVTGFEEATTEAGEPKGMVGRVLVSYKGTEIGCGPGKLTHAERTELWQEWTQWQAAIASGYKTTKWRRMACIQYKEDASYGALREPTFQHWRDDKETPDA